LSNGRDQVPVTSQVTGTSGIYRTGLAHFGTRPSDASTA